MTSLLIELSHLEMDTVHGLRFEDTYDSMTDRFLGTEKDVVELIWNTWNNFHQEIFSRAEDECCLEEVWLS